jgi:hypothetical protein
LVLRARLRHSLSRNDLVNEQGEDNKERQKGLANSVATERYYVPGGEVAVPGGTGLEPEVEAMCALLAGVSFRLNRECAVNRARLRIVK